MTMNVIYEKLATDTKKTLVAAKPFATREENRILSVLYYKMLDDAQNQLRNATLTETSAKALETEFLNACQEYIIVSHQRTFWTSAVKELSSVYSANVSEVEDAILIGQLTANYTAALELGLTYLQNKFIKKSDLEVVAMQLRKAMKETMDHAPISKK